MGRVEQKGGYEKWRTLILEQEKSGLSTVKFCKERNLIYSQFMYYRRVLKAKDPMQEGKALFSPIAITQTESFSRSPEMKILLPNGFQCILPMGMEPAQMKRLMEALLSC